MSFRGYSIRSMPSLAACLSSSCGNKEVSLTLQTFRGHSSNMLWPFSSYYFMFPNIFLFQSFFLPTSFSLLSQEPYISAVPILSSSGHLKTFNLFTLLRNPFVTPDICRRILYVHKLPQ